jgi:hypothetical protein
VDLGCVAGRTAELARLDDLVTGLSRQVPSPQRQLPTAARIPMRAGALS